MNGAPGNLTNTIGTGPFKTKMYSVEVTAARNRPVTENIILTHGHLVWRQSFRIVLLLVSVAAMSTTHLKGIKKSNLFHYAHR